MGNVMARVTLFIKEPSDFANAWPQTPPIRFPIAVYVHRGGPMEGFMENTMQAFRNSAKLKVDLLELDVQLTKVRRVPVTCTRTCHIKSTETSISDNRCTSTFKELNKMPFIGSLNPEARFHLIMHQDTILIIAC
jgi:hypothetical protein